MEKKRRDVAQCLPTLRRTRKRRPLVRDCSAITGRYEQGWTTSGNSQRPTGPIRSRTDFLVALRKLLEVNQDSISDNAKATNSSNTKIILQCMQQANPIELQAVRSNFLHGPLIQISAGHGDHLLLHGRHLPRHGCHLQDGMSGDCFVVSVFLTSLKSNSDSVVIDGWCKHYTVPSALYT